MALPNSIDAATPGGTDSPALGDDQLRALKTFLEDVFGIPDATSITAAAFSISAGGVVTVSQANTRMTSIELGHASDTTITRVSAGVIAVEGNNVALVSNNLSVFAATTSAQLFGVISDETGGAGVLVGSASPALTGTVRVTQALDNAFFQLVTSDASPYTWTQYIVTGDSFVIRDTTAGADRLTIDTSGNVTIASLAGVGSRTVVADANGVLSAP